MRDQAQGSRAAFWKTTFGKPSLISLAGVSSFNSLLISFYGTASNVRYDLLRVYSPRQVHYALHPVS